MTTPSPRELQPTTQPCVQIDTQGMVLPIAHGLIVWDATGDAVEYELQASRIGLGRGRRNQIRLQCEFLSTNHLEFVQHDSGYELHDLGSRNGTKVNGIQCQRHLLQDGDRILIGGRVAAHYMMVPDLGDHPGRSLREQKIEIATIRHLNLAKRLDDLEKRLDPNAGGSHRHRPGAGGLIFRLEDLLRRVEKLETVAGCGVAASDEEPGAALWN